LNFLQNKKIKNKSRTAVIFSNLETAVKKKKTLQSKKKYKQQAKV
jgi:hypothetical protein